MDWLQKAVDFFIRYQTTMGFSIMSLLMAAGEYVFSYVVFKCPCNSDNLVYGYSFLLAPACILLLLGYMINTTTWRLFTGTCSPKTHLQYRSWQNWAHFCQLFVLITVEASVAPLTWIAVALLGTSIYECAASGSNMTAHLFCKNNTNYSQEQLYKMPCDEELSAAMSSVCLNFHAQSQLIGWLLIASIVTLALISKCVTHCFSPVGYLRFKFWKFYSRKEHELFEIKAKEHATKLAERNTNYFFEATDPAPFHTPSNKDWQEVSVSYTFDSQKQCYSRLHQYVSNNIQEKVNVNVVVDEAEASV